MRTECINAVAAAAMKLGREMTDKQLQKVTRDIDGKVSETYRHLNEEKRTEFAKMSEKERLEAVSEIIIKDFEHKAIKEKQRVALNAIAKDRFYTAIGDVSSKSNISEADAILHLLVARADGQTKGLSLETMQQTTGAIYKSQLDNLWQLEHQNLINIFTNKKAQQEFFNELYGVDSGNPLAKKAAEQYYVVIDKLLKDLNDAGFDIPRLADYRSPQKLSAMRMWEKVGSKLENMKKTVDEIIPRLKREKYINEDGTPMNDMEMADFVEQAIRTILSDGANKAVGHGGSGTVAGRHKGHRQLHWKDADSYLYAMNNFADANPIDMIYHHIDQLGADLAFVKTFGPNGYQMVKDVITQKAGQFQSAKDLKKLNVAGQMLDDAVGIGREIHNHNVHRVFSNIKGAMSLTLLGSNIASQISDINTAISTARASNLPVFDLFKEAAIHMKQNGYGEVLRSAGYGIETATQNVGRAADTTGGGVINKLARIQLQINGSNYATNYIRQLYAGGMSKHVASMARRFKSMDDLLPDDRAFLEKKGVTKENWDIWRAAVQNLDESAVLSHAEIRNIDAATVESLIPDRVKAIREQAERIKISKRALDEKIGSAAESAKEDALMRLTGMILEETYNASVNPGLYDRRFSRGKAGEITSEIGGLFMQFKTFPIAYFQRHIYDRTRGAEGYVSKAAHLIPLLTGALVTGSLANWLNDVASGKTPREMIYEGDMKKTSRAFYQAMMKGGGFGIAGDLVNSVVMERDPVGELAGPAAGYLSKAANALQAGAAYGIEGTQATKEKFGDKSATLIKSSIPFQNLIWAKGVLHREILDDMHEFMSPGYKNRLQESAKKNYGSEVWAY